MMSAAFCGTTNLRTASFSIGWLGVAITILRVLCIVGFYLTRRLNEAGEPAPDSLETQCALLANMEIPVIAINTIGLICLFYGLCTDSSRFLVIYIGASIVVAGYDLALRVILVMIILKVGADILLHIIIALILGFAKLYFICVVSSYYQKLRSDYEEITNEVSIG